MKNGNFGKLGKNSRWRKSKMTAVWFCFKKNQLLQKWRYFNSVFFFFNSIYLRWLPRIFPKMAAKFVRSAFTEATRSISKLSKLVSSYNIVVIFNISAYTANLRSYFCCQRKESPDFSLLVQAGKFWSALHEIQFQEVWKFQKYLDLVSFQILLLWSW